MIRRLVWLLVLLAAAVALTAVIGHVRYLPGDVELARAIQAVAPPDLRWAEWLTAAARWPWLLAPLVVSVLLSLYLCGLRAAIGAVASLGAVWFLDKVLRHLVFQQRPAGDLIHVVPPQAHGSAFPSTAALIYAGTFGYLAVIAILRAGGVTRWLVAAACVAVLLLVAAARIVLGAHWPSEILVSYLYGFIVAGVLLMLVPRRRR